MNWAEALLLLGMLAGQFVVIPLVGAALLFLGLQVMGTPKQFTFCQAWKIYLAAVCFGLGVIISLNFLLPGQRSGAAGLVTVQAAVTCLAHLVMVLLRLREFSWRALAAQGGAVLLTNLMTIAVIYSISPHGQGTQS